MLVKNFEDGHLTYSEIDKTQMTIVPGADRLYIKNLKINLLELDGSEEPFVFFMFK